MDANNMDTNNDTTARAYTNEGLATEEAWTWPADDSISDRVTETVSRWLGGMERAIARSNSRT